jgi:hypothetical protein
VRFVEVTVGRVHRADHPNHCRRLIEGYQRLPLVWRLGTSRPWSLLAVG